MKGEGRMQIQWRNRLVKTNTISPRIGCETTPFVWHGRLCRLENHPIHWEDAPSDRPVLTFDPTHHSDPECHPEVVERSVSDAEICAWQDGTLVTFNGGDQQGVNDLQTARFDGPPREFLEHFFEP